MSTHRAEGADPYEPAATAGPPVTDRATVVARERERFGGVKPFVAFFGWLSATGMMVLLSAVLAAAGYGLARVTSTTDVGDVGDAASETGVDAASLTWAGVVVLLVVVLLSYYAGGYVAGRMARFDGMRQGVAVWMWALVVAIVLAVLGAVFGQDRLDGSGLPQLPTSVSDLSVQSVVGLVGVVVVSLVGAVLGGLAGMHFHRRVDRLGLGR